jgi:CelD/BcsL family acetyltransferase involved in cellulose biosynthesis
VKIRIATTRSGELAGAVVSLHFKDTVVYKYGASDARFHHLGTMQSLLWQSIEEAKNNGAAVFDFGRSEMEHLSLIRFKDQFGATQSRFTHKVFPKDAWEAGANDWKMRFAKKVFSKLPESLLILSGKIVYPFIG